MTLNFLQNISFRRILHDEAERLAAYVNEALLVLNNIHMSTGKFRAKGTGWVRISVSLEGLKENWMNKEVVGLNLFSNSHIAVIRKAS